MSEVPEFVKQQAASSLDIGNIQSNSNNKRQPIEEKVETHVDKPVVAGVKTKESKKLFGIFSKQDVKDIKDYVVYDVVIPSVKDTVSQVVSNAVDMMLFGEVRNRSRSRSSRGQSTYTSYNSMYDRPRSDRRDRPDREERPSRSSEPRELVFETRSEAAQVLDAMQDILDQYKICTVADMYDLVGITGSFTDNNWGWDDLRTARVVRSGRDGYSIELPRTISLK